MGRQLGGSYWKQTSKMRIVLFVCIDFSLMKLPLCLLAQDLRFLNNQSVPVNPVWINITGRPVSESDVHRDSNCILAKSCYQYYFC